VLIESFNQRTILIQSVNSCNGGLTGCTSSSRPQLVLYYLQLLLNLTNRQISRARSSSGQRREQKTSSNERKAHAARGHETRSHW
jgi:hypothetical protein